ncbi:Protein kinase domain-containing protein, partial [Psidium guajava]
KMKCFSFKNKSKCKDKALSAPECRTEREPGSSAANRSTKSLSSLPSPRRSITELYKEKQHTLRVFTYEELRQATNGFNRMLKIGEGGFGSVYKGTVNPPNGKGRPLVVAIKKLNQNGLQGRKEWLMEVQCLSIVDHPNLVKLLGYCSVENERGVQLLLVYEFMSNRSLDDHLFNRALPTLRWKTRLEIILGAAEGLAYLHEVMEPKVIYRDFKSSNVLLDENFMAKLSDFGMAREGPAEDRTHVTTAVVGTYGYAAPEYVETGHLTIQSDIWTFGVVLYEILTGRRAVERSRPPKEQKLLDWVKDYPSDSRMFVMIMDPRLRNQYSFAAARTVMKLAESCLSKNAKDRPTMGEVVSTLKQAIEQSGETATSAPGNAESSGTRKVVHRSK